MPVRLTNPDGVCTYEDFGFRQSPLLAADFRSCRGCRLYVDTSSAAEFLTAEQWVVYDAVATKEAMRLWESLNIGGSL